MVVPTADVRLSRLLRRDAGAEVERLYRKHSGEVLRYALLVLRSRSDAEDATQAVFIRALRAIERGEKVRTPRNWLIKIAHNECRRLLSSRKATVELPEQLAAEPEQHGQADELKRALEALPDSQRQALVLRELEGRSYAEIGATLSLSVSAVETLIFRARRSMREQLEGAMSCQEFAELLPDPSARSRIRAHARVCAACATLERQARGRKSALKRIASALGLPWWAPKVAAVAVTTATVAGVATAVPPKGHHRPAPPPAPALVERTVAPAAATAIARPAVRRARPASKHSPSPVVAKPAAAGTALPAASRSRPVPAAAAAPVPAPVPEPPAAAPAPAAPAAAPAPAAPAAAPDPAAPAPAADPAPATPPPAAPGARLPAPPVLPVLPVPAVPPVALPAPPPAPPTPVPVQDPPPVTVPAVTVPTVTVPLPPPPPLPPVPGLNVKGP
jgi:RNA polymerase sigma factor (sigma-70 family)